MRVFHVVSKLFFQIVLVPLLISCFLFGPQAHAQGCQGSPGFTCSSGSVICVNGSFTCSVCGATHCSLPPPTGWNCQCGILCTSNGWQCKTGCGSPIIIDINAEGFHLTDKEHGVIFKFFPDRPPVRISWTDPAYSNGFLVLDRNGDGVINDGAELFGNLSPQPPSDHNNGFLALAVFDDSANGGNGNGVIDPGDQIFERLRVWIDTNHDGISQSEEFHRLRELGIVAIDLSYVESRYVDSFGNHFRYRSKIMYSNRHEDRRTYDVFLQSEMVPGAELAKSRETNSSEKNDRRSFRSLE